jgi:hypothetical protein
MYSGTVYLAGFMPLMLAHFSSNCVTPDYFPKYLYRSTNFCIARYPSLGNRLENRLSSVLMKAEGRGQKEVNPMNSILIPAKY